MLGALTYSLRVSARVAAALPQMPLRRSAQRRAWIALQIAFDAPRTMRDAPRRPTASRVAHTKKAAKEEAADAEAAAADNESVEARKLEAVSVEGPEPTPPVPRERALTPMLRQWESLKREYPEYLLLFHVGDFYEMFFDDAVKASALLSITLTRRGRDTSEQEVPMCGVPQHALSSYLKRLIRQGVLVAVCEQVEDPKAARKRGDTILRREVVRLVTPGTLIEDALLNPRRNNFVAALSFPFVSATLRGSAAGGQALDLGLAWMDVSTGELFSSPTSAPNVLHDLVRVEPAEIVVSSELLALFPTLRAELERLGSHITVRPLTAFDTRSATRLLQRLEAARAQSAAAPPGSAPPPSLSEMERRFETLSALEFSACGALLDYVQFTHKGRLPRILAPQQVPAHSTVTIDAATRRSLEIVGPASARPAGALAGASLLSTLDRTVTPGGSRLLASRLCAPLRDVARISARLDAVEWFSRFSAFRELRALLKKCFDVERCVQRLALGKGGPRDLLSVAQTVQTWDALATLLLEFAPPPAAQRLIAEPERVAEVRALAAELLRALVPSPPVLADDGGFIAQGYSAELDALRSMTDKGRHGLTELQEQYRSATGAPSLKLRHVRGLGHFAEMSAATARAATLPPGFVLFQTLKSGALRFRTAELSAIHDRMASHSEEAVEFERRLFQGLVDRTGALSAPLMRIAHSLAAVDVASSLGLLAAERDYVRPRVLPADDAQPRVLKIEAGRHPTVEAGVPETLGTRFTPNDVALRSDDKLQWLITGPNMAGKSTFLRQAALIAVMAQSGCFVPARAAELSVVDRIFSRVGSSDDISRDRSSFMVEMLETTSILRSASPHSLVIMDEVGRGTATFDGLAIAMAVLEHLHNVNRCRTLFASHYHELHHLQASLPALGCHHMATERQADGSIVFLHKVLPGVVLQSYGVFVARLAGIPESVASRAEELLERLRASQDLYRGLIAAVFERGAGSTTQGQRQPAEAARQQQQQQGQTELQRQAERAP